MKISQAIAMLKALKESLHHRYLCNQLVIFLGYSGKWDGNDVDTCPFPPADHLIVDVLLHL